MVGLLDVVRFDVRNGPNILGVLPKRVPGKLTLSRPLEVTLGRILRRDSYRVKVKEIVVRLRIPVRWSCFFDQIAAQLRWIRVSSQAAILMGSVWLAWTSSGVKMPWVEWGRSAL
jgi:hypothetical protein